jgi:hypothetical protein
MLQQASAVAADARKQLVGTDFKLYSSTASSEVQVRWLLHGAVWFSLQLLLPPEPTLLLLQQLHHHSSASDTSSYSRGMLTAAAGAAAGQAGTAAFLPSFCSDDHSYRTAVYAHAVTAQERSIAACYLQMQS